MSGDEHGRSMQELRPTVWIGRQGVTEKVVREVAVQLKKRHRIKVKWLRNVDADPEDLARQADATVLEVRGRTAVLAEQKTG